MTPSGCLLFKGDDHGLVVLMHRLRMICGDDQGVAGVAAADEFERLSNLTHVLVSP